MPVPVQRTAPDPEAIKQAVHMLLAAKNPILWAGQGVHYAEAGDLLAALAELLPAPVVTTNPGKSAIPDSHPLSLGASTRSRSKMFTDYMAKADLSLCHRVEPDADVVRTGGATWQIHHPLHQRSDDINKEYRQPSRWSVTPRWWSKR